MSTPPTLGKVPVDLVVNWLPAGQRYEEDRSFNQISGNWVSGSLPVDVPYWFLHLAATHQSGVCDTMNAAYTAGLVVAASRIPMKLLNVEPGQY